MTITVLERLSLGLPFLFRVIRLKAASARAMAWSKSATTSVILMQGFFYFRFSDRVPTEGPVPGLGTDSGEPGRNVHLSGASSGERVADWNARLSYENEYITCTKIHVSPAWKHRLVQLVTSDSPSIYIHSSSYLPNPRFISSGNGHRHKQRPA